MKTVEVGNSASAYYAAATTSDSKEIVHVSGQPGSLSDGQVPNDYGSQIYLALLNLRKVLLAAGCKISDILMLRSYIFKYNPNRRIHTRHLQAFLGSHRPGMTLVPVPQLAGKGWLFEIEAVAARPHRNLGRIPRSLSTGYDTFDIVIIGAGLAGLAAATKVQEAGLSCVVLEARSRVGGRTWSSTVSGGDGVVDLGAAWINDTNQSRMIALARRFNLELIEQNTNGNCVLQANDGTLMPFPYGELPPFPVTIKNDIARIRDLAEAHCQQLDCACPRDSVLDSMTFATYLRANNTSEEAFKTASVWTRAMLGHEPEDISALFFLNYCKSGGGLLQMRSDRKHGGQYLRLRKGTQQFALNLAKHLSPSTIRLSSAVTAVQQLGKDSVLVHANGQCLRAKKVIVAVPPPVLKKITFDPPLPLAKQLLIDSYKYGFYQKVMVVFKSPFWISKGFCGLTQSFRGPAAVIRDTSSPADQKWILTCFMAGTPGLEWSHKEKTERERVLIEQIAELFGSPRAKEELVGFLTLPWSDEEFSGFGCPSPALGPGVLDVAGHAVREKAGDVHFVGTETAEEWKGYMEGAVRSGERGAAEVVDALPKIVAKL